MRILFISPPWSDVYGAYKSAAKVGNNYPPLGLCYLATILDRQGDQTKVIDAEAENQSLDDLLESVQNFRPDAIGFTAATPGYHTVSEICKHIKAKFPSIPIFLGGPHASIFLDKILIENPNIDFCVFGEAERTIKKLVDVIAQKIDPKEALGVCYRNGSGEVVRNESAGLVDDLDSIPFPDREKLSLDKYVWSVPGKGIVKFTTLMTSRGCPFLCNFCSAHTVFGRKVRNRSIEKVLDEIEMVVNNLGISHFSFIDDTLTLDHKRVYALCDGLKERNLNITWEGWTRANTVDEEILKRMRESGFVRISFGIESANKEIAKIIKKGVPLESYRSAYAAAKKAGIETRGSIILGNPKETHKTAMETIRFACSLKDCDQLYVNIATPYPGTELYSMAKQGQHGMKLLTDDFSEYRRYGDAVVEVNDLKSKDLVDLQRKAFRMFYLSPVRIWYNFKRAGLKAFLKNAWAFTRSVLLAPFLKK